MADKPIKGKIVDVQTAAVDNFVADSVFVEFQLDGKTIKEDFGSPLFKEENIRLWRAIVASVVLDKRIKQNDKTAYIFGQYREAIVDKPVWIAYDNDEVYAIGAKSNHMFFPDEYGLWNVPKSGDMEE
jgi:hypothetical protein